MSWNSLRSGRAFATAVVFLALASCRDSPNLSDARLIRDFSARRASFDRLLQMLRDDSQVRSIGTEHLNGLERTNGRWLDVGYPNRPSVSTDEAFAQAGIDLTRFDEYQTLLDSLGSALVDVVRQGSIIDRVYIEMDLAGVLLRACRTHIVWVGGDISEPIVTEDTVEESLEGGRRLVFRNIEGSWYISRDRD
jgi:hypothetical protein